MYARSVFVLFLLALRPAAAARKPPSWLELSWLFDWNYAGETYPIPTTAQCETLHIKWSRQTGTGPDGVAPYFLQLYSSDSPAPFIIPAGSTSATDLTIPFVPGTQFEICMFDSKGNTGGCQAIYSVYPNTTTPEPTCANLTMPANTLKVLSEKSEGLLSEIGWVNSCSDIRVTPQGGTPPFTFTVAPALHPPLNITSNDMSPINWTVNLSWGMPFFISMVDSTGLSWSNGPLHSGDGDTACLSDASSEKTVSAAVAGGAVVAGVTLGVLLALAAAFLVNTLRKPRNNIPEADEKVTPYFSSDSDPQLGSRRETRTFNSSQGPSSRLPVVYGSSNMKRGPGPSESQPSYGRADSSGSTTSSTANSQVYLIHNDSGRAPVNVITSNGTQVVELPPGYSPNYSPAIASSGVQGRSTLPTPRPQEKSTALLEGSSGSAS